MAKVRHVSFATSTSFKLKLLAYASSLIFKDLVHLLKHLNLGRSLEKPFSLALNPFTTGTNFLVRN
jgi:hypothetical protein